MSYLALMEQDMGLEEFKETAQPLTEEEARDAAAKLILEVLAGSAREENFHEHGLFAYGSTVLFLDKDNDNQLTELKPRCVCG